MTVASRFDIGSRIGGGAAADVYLARDRHLGRDVALKILRPAIAEVPELVDRFAREADAIAGIAHPNIVRILDHGRIDGAPFLALEYVDGLTLQQLLRMRGRLSENEARHIGAQIAAALDAAHARGIVHRDLKPANVLVASDGTAKVADFGVAHLEAATQLTRTGEVLGTPRYVAPEQIEGRVDARTDVYALGIVLFELVTGRPPFDGDSPVAIVQQQLRTHAPSPRSLVSSVSRDFERIVLRALEKDPAKRFRSAAEMRRALLPPVAAAVPALAARRTTPAPASAPLPVRAFATVIASAALVVMLASGALAHLADLATFARPAEAPVAAATVRPTERASAPPAVRAATVAPSPTPTPTPTPTPAPTATPTAAPITTPAPTARAVALSTADDPRAAIASFYELVSAHRYDEAAALWSARMRAAYPPATNIYGRFDQTTSITVRASSISALTAGTATVNVDLVEMRSDGSMRHWVGEWSLARSGAKWLMDAPALRTG